MKTLVQYIRGGFQFLTNETTTVAILAAVIAVSFFAFVLGADQELVIGLLLLGLITALAEARMHARTKDKTDASQ